VKGIPYKMIFSLIFIFILGYSGYRIFNLLHIPLGAVGSSLITLAIVTSQGFECAELHGYIITILQVIIGVTIGCRFKKTHIPIMKSLFVPGLISSIWMVLICLAVGIVLAEITELDLGTALYSSVPGGLSEIGLLALSFNLSVPTVTLIQFIRIVSIRMSLPLVVSYFNFWFDRGSKRKYRWDNSKRSPGPGKGKVILNSTNKDSAKIGDVLLLLLFGSIGGFAAKHLGVPVGGLLGSMVMIGALNIAGVPLKVLPKWLINSTQIITGGYLGTTFVPEIHNFLKPLLIPVLIFSFFIVLSGIIMGIIFHKVLKWDLTTALLANAAGGIALMTLTAVEVNSDPIRVSIVQTLRVAIIILIMPFLLLFIV
jgi:membrane AbrB-like protein